MTDEEPIQPGDRVVHLQVPGVCIVIARKGKFFLELESSTGVRKLVHEVSVRRVARTAPVPRDA